MINKTIDIIVIIYLTNIMLMTNCLKKLIQIYDLTKLKTLSTNGELENYFDVKYQTFETYKNIHIHVYIIPL